MNVLNAHKHRERIQHARRWRRASAAMVTAYLATALTVSWRARLSGRSFRPSCQMSKRSAKSTHNSVNMNASNTHNRRENITHYAVDDNGGSVPGG